MDYPIELQLCTYDESFAIATCDDFMSMDNKILSNNKTQSCWIQMIGKH